VTEPDAAGARVQIRLEGGGVVYEGEAIYRPAKPHPRDGQPVPQVGVPDDNLGERPRGDASYTLRLRGEDIPVAAVYLERVSTCWWFVLARA
jgi:hypothetical protein